MKVIHLLTPMIFSIEEYRRKERVGTIVRGIREEKIPTK